MLELKLERKLEVEQRWDRQAEYRQDQGVGWMEKHQQEQECRADVTSEAK
jgi:hypothetical protein